MYLYFKSIHAVVTCEEYPDLLSVEEMKANQLEHRCDKWEKTDNADGTFTVSFKYERRTCNCDHEQRSSFKDDDLFECYNCGIKSQPWNEGCRLYLQNSGNLDIVCVKPSERFSKMCEVAGYPDIYKWVHPNEALVFALHVKNNMLSDENVANALDTVQESCHLVFTDQV